MQVLLVELFALAEDRDHDMPFWIAILPGQAVEQRRGQLDGGRMKRNDQPFGQCRQLRPHALL